ERRVAEIEIAQRTAEGDRAEIDTIAENRCAPLDLVEPGGHLLELAGYPIVPAQRFRSQDRLVAREHGGVLDAIGERLLDKHAPARRPGLRNELAISQRVQVLAYHAAVEKPRPLRGGGRRSL